jgi:hypothetical protein
MTSWFTQLMNGWGSIFDVYLHTIIEQVNRLVRIGQQVSEKVTRLIHVAEKLADQGEQIIKLLTPPPGKMDLQWGTPVADNVTTSQIREDTNMPGKETDTQTIPCTEMETDGQGNPVTLIAANVQWAIDDPTIATLTQNSDGSATFKAVKPVPPAVNPRTANVTCTDTVTGVVATDTLEVDDSPTQPGKMVLTFGTPA